ncbi:MAG: ribonuclease H-like domain-containing protein, partial [Nitrospirae bacterium]|nr:ribonuclease H-like domain-containing protein [Nitrospirota bacterium]
GGLKSIEHTIGLERSPDIQGLNGWDAVILWEAWLKGDPEAKKRLCDYNEADVRNLEPLAEHIYSYFYDHYGPPNNFY